ncbi:lipopolysaccharide biosynthesis protein [Vibrio breoganii]|uniref:lipopolysaccharide biosynthesis protein n=1 Tax=Vibrio breoganii TaxID=553239 RepID=UPI000C836A54|nr:oligosaccharide flippase family protein [Vibrio breoganii]PMG83493.1 hypothetical protein BCU81_15025 [Vibrio breoganii]
MKTNIHINTVSTYSAFVISRGIAFFSIPFVLAMLGKEVYGLVGFFMVVQGMLNILDVGISGSVTREIAKRNTSDINLSTFNKIIKKVNVVYMLVATCILIFGFLLQEYISEAWLKTTLDKNDVLVVLQYVLVSFTFLFYINLPRSILVGLEKHVQLGVLNILFSIAYTILPIFIVYLTDNYIHFFLTQMIASISICVCYCILAYYYYPHKNVESIDKGSEGFSLRNFVMTSLSLSYISVLWIIVSNLDKLLLSNKISLSDFAPYSIAISVATVLLSVISPLSQLVQPRLTNLYAQKDTIGAKSFITKAFCYFYVFFLPIGFIIHYYGDFLVFTWLKDLQLSNQVNLYLPWLVSGVIASLLVKFAFFILYAKGQLKMHTIVYTIHCMFLIPLMFYVVKTFEPVDAAKLFFFQNLFISIVWGGYVFYKNIPGFLTRILIPMLLITCSYWFATSELCILLKDRIGVYVSLSLCLFMMVIPAVFLLAFNRTLFSTKYFDMSSSKI